ncbi:MAG: polysaccharide biosynthesis tyrosine autokinase [Desulfobacteraceae bacterium]|nr:polysaccharide biosynthesis tyrosine autokinase [Desulfobacteraceae bacterium]
MNETIPGLDHQTRQAPEEDIELGQMLAVILNSKALISAITLLTLAVALAYCLLATPIYQSDTLIQVETRSNGISGLEEFSGLVQNTSTTAEIEIIKSRSILGAAVEDLNLTLVAGPEYFPLIGRAYARRFSGTQTTPPQKAPLGLDSYAWGGEEIMVQRLTIPKSWEGRNLYLVAGEDESFTINATDGTIILRGQVGTTARANDGQLEIFVTVLKARPATRFHLTLQPTLRFIEKLQQDLNVNEQGHNTGIIRINLKGPTPVQLAMVLNSIANIYLRQDIEKGSTEAQKTLEFLNQQLPLLKADLEVAESRLNAYKSAKGSIDLTLDTQRVLEMSSDLEKQLSELKLQGVTLAEKFTARHPAMITLSQQQEQLVSQIVSINNQIKAMPDDIQEAVRLQRDVKVANELYLLLLNKAQAMKVVKAGTVGSVRIIDPAVVPGWPVKPNKRRVLVLGFFLGLLGGIGAAFLKKSLNKGVEDPDQIEEAIGLPIYATIPHSKKEEELGLLQRKNKKSASGPYLLALADKKDLAVESLRSLRTSLQFAMLDAENNLVSISGPSPHIGKSFVSANLAAILADGGKRVLLIDADMRKSSLHKYFGLNRGDGLSGLISRDISIPEAIHQTSLPQLDLVLSGIIPPNPSELLMHERFRQVLQELASQYDVVIIDTPPTLAVTDAVIIAQLCSLNFLVIKAGAHPIREIQQAVKRYTQNHIRPTGIIMNDIKPQAGIGKYGYCYNYQYSYK